MTTQSLTNGAPTLVGSGPTREELTPAERYARDRALLSYADSDERKAAVARLVEAGSSAIYPLLCVVHDDTSMEVREAAIWSLLRFTDDLLGENSEENKWISRLLQDDPAMDRYLRLGIEAVDAKRQGRSPATTAFGRLFLSG